MIISPEELANMPKQEIEIPEGFEAFIETNGDKQVVTIKKTNKPKVGDVAIVWSDEEYSKSRAIIGVIINIDLYGTYCYTINDGSSYENAVKFESMEQYLKIVNS